MVCVSMATPGTEACDAAGGASRPQWREWPGREFPMKRSHPRKTNSRIRRIFLGTAQANSCARHLRGFCFLGSSRTSQVPPIKHPLALGAAASRFSVPQENGARKGEKFMSYLIVSWNSSGSGFTRQAFPPLKHVRFPLATPGTEACDAMGGAFRPQWRELPAIVLRLSLQCCPKPVRDRCQARRSFPTSRLERSRSASDATRDVNGATVA
jgi:hypothetical protein